MLLETKVQDSQPKSDWKPSPQRWWTLVEPGCGPDEDEEDLSWWKTLFSVAPLGCGYWLLPTLTWRNWWKFVDIWERKPVVVWRECEARQGPPHYSSFRTLHLQNWTWAVLMTWRSWQMSWRKGSPNTGMLEAWCLYTVESVLRFLRHLLYSFLCDRWWCFIPSNTKSRKWIKMYFIHSEKEIMAQM